MFHGVDDAVEQRPVVVADLLQAFDAFTAGAEFGGARVVLGAIDLGPGVGGDLLDPLGDVGPQPFQLAVGGLEPFLPVAASRSPRALSSVRSSAACSRAAAAVSVAARTRWSAASRARSAAVRSSSAARACATAVSFARVASSACAVACSACRTASVGSPAVAVRSSSNAA